MKIHLKIRQKNSHFNYNYAKQYYRGFETSDNQRYNWSREYETKEIRNYRIIENDTLSLSLQDKGDVTLNNLTLIQVEMIDGATTVLCFFSQKLIDQISITNRNSKTTLIVNIIDTDDYTFIGDMNIVDPNQITE